jgi:hypothetical protein
MQTHLTVKKIGLLGGGPAALFMYKRLIESAENGLEIFIFEKHGQLGAGMPYSKFGANKEHITNVSDNEIPELVTSIKDWLKNAPTDLLKEYDISPEYFNEYKVLPRLLFGKYLEAQFNFLLTAAKKNKIETHVLYHTKVVDVIYIDETKQVRVCTDTDVYVMDAVIICTGHSWPYKTEKNIKGWYDSPYPPAKLQQKINFSVAIKGSSLTAIDAIRTLARANGNFNNNAEGELVYTLDKGSENFRMIMYSLGAFLPGMRFHLDDTHLSPQALLTEEEVYAIKEKNDGFISLDFIFDRNFKMPLQKESPDFYEEIKDMELEEFVDNIMHRREKLESFKLFKAEYAEAEKSIRRHQSVKWKESLAALSYAMNYPAKHFSAEDMLRLKKILMPLISIVIAFVPQSSAKELLALHAAGLLEIIGVDRNSTVTPNSEEGAIYTYTDDEGKKHEIAYKMFVDAVGQPPMLYNDFPFESLRINGIVSGAHLRFREAAAAEKEITEGNNLVTKDSNENYYLQVPGININDHFQVLDRYGSYNNHIYIMAVPYIGGVNPDYSGLDFCEAASERIIKVLFKEDLRES